MMKIYNALLFILLLTPLLVSGGVDQDTGYNVTSLRHVDGEFYARVLHRDDVHDVGVYEVEVKVIPSTGEWPGVDVGNETIKEVNIHTLIRIRGLHAPGDHRSRLRPHVSVERERGFFVGAMAFVWKLLSAHEYLILADPVLVESPVGSGARVTEVDAYLEIAGQRISLAEAIIFKGHGTSNWMGDHDWGTRDVPPK